MFQNPKWAFRAIFGNQKGVFAHFFQILLRPPRGIGRLSHSALAPSTIHAHPPAFHPFPRLCHTHMPVSFDTHAYHIFSPHIDIITPFSSYAQSSWYVPNVLPPVVPNNLSILILSPSPCNCT